MLNKLAMENDSLKQENDLLDIATKENINIKSTPLIGFAVGIPQLVLILAVIIY